MVQTDIEFRYWTNGQKLPLPEWGKFYLQLGAAVAQMKNVQECHVTALAVPTRSYAAVLVAGGMIISRGKTTDSETQTSPSDHFKMLGSLPSGTSVILRRGEKAVKGLLVGMKDIRVGMGNTNKEGIPMIGVQTQSGKGGSHTEWLPVGSSLKIQISSKVWTRLPANLEKTKDASTSRSDFVSRVFQDADLWNFLTTSTLNCVILGNVGPLVQEATLTKLSVGSRGREASAGTLRDILRIRRLYNNNEAFRSDIFPVNAKSNVMSSEEMVPHLVIFDGSVGFLKWRHNWAHCNWVVILDRTEPRFTEAVQVVNEEYLSRISEGKLKLSDPPPRSVELVTFTSAR